MYVHVYTDRGLCAHCIYMYIECFFLFQPKLNEQPAVRISNKRPANDENLEPVALPPAKQPRTIDINLPNRWEDFTSSENTAKGKYVRTACKTYYIHVYT